MILDYFGSRVLFGGDVMCLAKAGEAGAARRELILSYGVVSGLSRAEVRSKFDQINRLEKSFCERGIRYGSRHLIIAEWVRVKLLSCSD